MVVMNYYLFQNVFVTFFILEVQRFHCRLSTKRLYILDRLDENYKKVCTSFWLHSRYI